MELYESVIIFKPELSDNDIETSLRKIEGMISKDNGKIINIERWGKKRLAYHVKKNRQGTYILIQHESEPKTLLELRNAYQLIEDILRYQVIRLDRSEKDKSEEVVEEKGIEKEIEVSGSDQKDIEGEKK
ncbi:MAG: 30S ribosomal protein S6 [Nitrospinota bacterium]